MKQSTINQAIADAMMAFQCNGWAMPPKPRWDVTGFGLDDFTRTGLTVINLAELPEYCEKLMYARQGQETPIHKHNNKQEDIICRTGVLAIELFASAADGSCEKKAGVVEILLNGEKYAAQAPKMLYLKAGERVTLYPGAYHRFFPVSEYCIIGEVSTCNDDTNDNIFDNPNIKRFDQVERDAPPMSAIIGVD